MSQLEKAFASTRPQEYWGKARNAELLATLEDVHKLFDKSVYLVDVDYTFRLQRVLCRAVHFFHLISRCVPGTPDQISRYATIMRICADQLYVICGAGQSAAVGLREFISQCPHPFLEASLTADSACWQMRDCSEEAFRRETAHARFARLLAGVLVQSQERGAGYPDPVVDYRAALGFLHLVLREWPPSDNRDYLAAAKVALLADGPEAARAILRAGLRKMEELQNYDQMLDLERMLGAIRNPSTAVAAEVRENAPADVLPPERRGPLPRVNLAKRKVYRTGSHTKTILMRETRNTIWVEWELRTLQVLDMLIKTPNNEVREGDWKTLWKNVSLKSSLDKHFRRINNSFKGQRIPWKVSRDGNNARLVPETKVRRNVLNDRTC